MVVRLHLHELVELHLPEAIHMLLAGGAPARPVRQEHLGLEALHDGRVVLVGDERALPVLLMGVLDHPEERVRHLPAVDDELRAEDLVAAVLGVHLAEHHELGVGGVASGGGEALREVLHLRLADRKAQLGVRLADRRDALRHHVEGAAGTRRRAVEEVVERVVDALGHPVVERVQELRVRTVERGLDPEADAALDTGNAREAAVAEDVRRLRAPRGDRALAGRHVECAGLKRGLVADGVQKRRRARARCVVGAVSLALERIHPRGRDVGLGEGGRVGGQNGAERVETELRIGRSPRKQDRFHLHVAFALKLSRNYTIKPSPLTGKGTFDILPRPGRKNRNIVSGNRDSCHENQGFGKRREDRVGLV